MEMGRPPNTLPMTSGKGPFGAIEAGGMFTVLKVREGITSYEDPGWYSTRPEPWRARSPGDRQRTRKLRIMPISSCSRLWQ